LSVIAASPALGYNYNRDQLHAAPRGQHPHRTVSIQLILPLVVMLEVITVTIHQQQAIIVMMEQLAIM